VLDKGRLPRLLRRDRPGQERKGGARNRTDKNPNPYAVLALTPTHAIAVDAGGNTVYDVNGSSLKLLAVIPKLPNGAQSVPTSIALGPDGAYYVGEFGGEAKKPLKNGSRVLRID
jgi:hypothetical protein